MAKAHESFQPVFFYCPFTEVWIMQFYIYVKADILKVILLANYRPTIFT